MKFTAVKSITQMGRVLFICLLHLQAPHPSSPRHLPVDPAALRLVVHPSIPSSVQVFFLSSRVVSDASRRQSKTLNSLQLLDCKYLLNKTEKISACYIFFPPPVSSVCEFLHLWNQNSHWIYNCCSSFGSTTAFKQSFFFLIPFMQQI